MDREPSWRPHSEPFDPAAAPAAAVVQFWAEWNHYDPQMDRLLCGSSDLFDDDLPLRSCDVDREANWATAGEAKALNVPALALVVNGHLLDTLVGVPTEEKLRSKLEEWRTKVAAF